MYKYIYHFFLLFAFCVRCYRATGVHSGTQSASTRVDRTLWSTYTTTTKLCVMARIGYDNCDSLIRTVAFWCIELLFSESKTKIIVYHGKTVQASHQQRRQPAILSHDISNSGDSSKFHLFVAILPYSCCGRFGRCIRVSQRNAGCDYLGAQTATTSLLVGAQTASASAVTLFAEQLVVLIKATGANNFIKFFVLFTAVTLLSLGLVFDRELTFQMMQAILEPLSEAIPVVWGALSNPKLILAYGLVILILSICQQYAWESGL